MSKWNFEQKCLSIAGCVSKIIGYVLPRLIARKHNANLLNMIGLPRSNWLVCLTVSIIKNERMSNHKKRFILVKQEIFIFYFTRYLLTWLLTRQLNLVFNFWGTHSKLFFIGYWKIWNIVLKNGINCINWHCH